MDDLISRAAVKEAIIDYKRKMKHIGPFELNRIVDIYALIKDLPTVDAVPVVHGKWVKENGYATPGGDPVWKCSICGKGIHVYGVEHGSYGADIADGQWVSCPNCGAVMNGEVWG